MASDGSRDDLHVGCAAVSPFSPASVYSSFLWRSDRHGGPARAEFGNTNAMSKRRMKKMPRAAGVLHLQLCVPVMASRTVSCWGSLPFLTALSQKQNILYLCQSSPVTHVQSKISLIDFGCLFSRKPSGSVFYLLPVKRLEMQKYELCCRCRNMRKRSDSDLF